MNNFEERCISVYQASCNVASIEKANVLKSKSEGFYHWQAKWSHCDLGRNSKITSVARGSLTSMHDELTCSKSPFSCEVKHEKLTSLSPSGELVAKLLEIEIKKDKHFFLEVWKESKKVSSSDLTLKKKHGIVHSNAAFGCLNWSHDSDKILYIAEKKSPKSKSYFDKTDEDGESGKQFVYKENWGEQLVDCFHPTLFMYDVLSGDVTDLSHCFPNEISISTALWSINDKCVYALAWMSAPWKLGLIYCKNRISNLVKLNLATSETTNLTDGKTCVFSPVLNRNATKLLYLENIPFGPHMQCSKLKCIGLNEEEEKHSSQTIIDVVKRQENAKEFQGLFIDKIGQECWLSNGKQMIVHSIHRSNIALLSIDITTGEVTVLESEGAWKVLHVLDNIIFTSYSTPNMPPVFKAGLFKPDKINWLDIDSPFEKINSLSWTVEKHEPNAKNKDYPNADFESILVKPKNGEEIIGLIVNPHGGPHSCYASGYDCFTACFAQLGFAVLRVNYRGSLGFGQNNVFSLPSRIGHQDVCDVQQAAEEIAKRLSIDPSKIFVSGGSHGGFLTLQLVGQYPDFYAAGATRNPVCNLLSMRGTTDIMDWCLCESGSSFEFANIPSSESNLKYLKCSPIEHVAHIKAPLLFMLGSGDLRVPPSQSHEYIRCLKGLGKKVEVLKYDGNSHAIANVDAEADCFINTAKWFIEHTA